MNQQLILASNSPRRLELLELLELPFTVRAPEYEEVMQVDVCPAEEVLLFARGKAKSLQAQCPDAILLGCDTMVELAGQKLGKPKDAEEALDMLLRLSGRVHRVLTGVSLLDANANRCYEALGQTMIKMREFDEVEARAYVETGEPLDKAGAYAIQGQAASFIEVMEGDYFNVIGLPLRALAELLVPLGFDIKVSMDELYACHTPKFS